MDENLKNKAIEILERDQDQMKGVRYTDEYVVRKDAKKK